MDQSLWSEGGALTPGSSGTEVRPGHVGGVAATQDACHLESSSRSPESCSIARNFPLGVGGCWPLWLCQTPQASLSPASLLLDEDLQGSTPSLGAAPPLCLDAEERAPFDNVEGLSLGHLHIV